MARKAKNVEEVQAEDTEVQEEITELKESPTPKITVIAKCEWCGAKKEDRPAVFCDENCLTAHLAVHPQK